MRFVQSQLAGAQLFLSVVALRDIAQDQHDLRVGHRLQAGFVASRGRRVGANLDLEVHRRAALGQPHQRLVEGAARRGVEDVDDRPPDRPAARRFGVGGAFHVEDDAVAVEPEDLVGEGAHQGAQLGVGLQQFLRAEVERTLEHGAVVVELAIGLVDALEHWPQLGRNLTVVKVALELTSQQAVAIRHGQRSDRVVTVMVWL